MTTDTASGADAPAIDESRLENFVHQVFGELSASYGILMMSLGHRLGLYTAMAGAGPVTSSQLAEKAGCAERYVREWLNSQAAGGYIDYDAETGTYSMPVEHAIVLADPESPVHLPPASEVVASMWFDQDKAVDSFRTGAGVSWGDHHERLYCGVAAFFRTGYKANIVPNWLPALDGVVGKLQAGANVADVGCGHGHSTILMAQAFPNSAFVGYDVHPGSIEDARRNAEAEGVGDRVSFEIARAKDLPADRFDLVCFFDCLHDLGDPVGAARHAFQALKDDGTVMLVEPFAGDTVEDNLNPIGRLYYAASTTLCCAHSLSEEVGLALGAQAGEARLADVFREAGFGSFRRATETPFNLVLEAKKGGEAFRTAA